TALALDIETDNPFRLAATRSGARDKAALRCASRLNEPILTKRSLGERIKAKFQGLAIHAMTQLRPLDPQSSVHIAPVSDYNVDLADVVRRQYEHFRARVPLAG